MDGVLQRPRPQTLEALEDVRCPAEHVASGDNAPHRAHTDLPLFALPELPAPAPPKSDGLRMALDALNPDEMTPRAALEAIYALKKAASA